MPPRPAVYRSPVGMKRYELSNHPGNVMTVISDKIAPIDTTSDGLWDYFNPSLVSATDYYPFGMLQPGRNFSSSEYRYGFNSQEKVDEISGSGNHTTAEFWEYDTRLVRRWNIDPVVKPWESGYAVMGNNPIWNKDPNGDDFVNVHTERKKEAKEKVDEAASNLENAKEGFKSFEGMTKKNAKAAGVLKEFKQARSELNTAQKNFNKADATYNQEVEYEAIVNDVLNQFKSVNPEKFAEFDKFDPFNRGIIDIHVSAQNAEIQMLDKNGFPTGRTTVEGINARLGNANHKEDYVRVRLKVIKVDGIVKLQSMTGSLVHGLGHIEGGKRQDETHAVKFKKEQFDDKLKKN